MKIEIENWIAIIGIIVQRHIRTQHKSYSNNKIPVIVDQTLPTQVGYGALTPCVQTESNNNNNTVTTEDYEKVVDIANGWKRECEKVQQEWKMLDNELYNTNIDFEKLENINKNIHVENKNHHILTSISSCFDANFIMFWTLTPRTTTSLF